MAKIVEFTIARDGGSSGSSNYGMVTSLNGVLEQIGPNGYEKYSQFKRVDDITSVTVPHIDRFPNCNIYKNIVLTGKTELFTIPTYGGSFEYSVKQYFLENPIVQGRIQYLFWDNEAVDSTISLIALVPGLVYSPNGTVLGYLHSYVADGNENVEFEIPYTDDLNDYTISGAVFEPIADSNLIIFRGINTETTITISKDGDTATFKLFAYGSSTGTNVYKIKNVNEFVDYIIAAQLTDGKITNILDMLTEVVSRNSVYYPRYFMTLRLYTSSESVKNITPNIYKVPAALVPKNGNKVFMTDVTGISGNIVSNPNTAGNL